MRTFTDSKGRSWVVCVDGWTVRQIKRSTGYRLMDAFNQERTLFNDTDVVMEVIWELCRKQAESATVTEEDFCRAIHGDTLNEATKVLAEEIVDFFANRAEARIAIEHLNAEIQRTRSLPENNSSDATSNGAESAASAHGILPLAS